MNNRYGWYGWQITLLLLTGALLLLVFENTGLDLWLAQQFFDPVLEKFPLHHHWFFDSVMHHGMKSISYILVAAALYFCFLGYRGELAWLPRRNALLAGVGMVLIPVSITLLKEVTDRHCPWDMVEFGGFVPYQTLLGPHLSGLKEGQCFPAGHASAGFLWLVWGFALRPAGKNMARLGLLVGLSMGTIMGFGRMLQGAHFLSHTLWTLWFSWAICVVLAFFLKADMRITVPAAPPVSGPEDACPDSCCPNQAQ